MVLEMFSSSLDLNWHLIAAARLIESHSLPLEWPTFWATICTQKLFIKPPDKKVMANFVKKQSFKLEY